MDHVHLGRAVFSFLASIALGLALSSAPTRASSPDRPLGAGGTVACLETVGTLALHASAVRSAGISPIVFFFDATATTDSATLGGANNAIQDVYFSWNFGDTAASGTGTWSYGSNPGNNSMNVSTGPVAAHEYITNGSDTTYTVTVTAYDGTNTSSCKMNVTAYDPGGSNGFPTAQTTCVSSSGLPVAGANACPSGAGVLETSSFNTALGSSYIGSGKRVLFKCGDSFTGDNASVSGSKWSVGAYGSCVGTKTGLPTLTDSGTIGQIFVNNTTSTYDGRISDLALVGNGSTSAGIEASGSGLIVVGQITINNIVTSNECANFASGAGAQWAVVNSVGGRTYGTCIGSFFNYAENNPCATSVDGQCWVGTTFPEPDYLALMGNSFTGIDSTSGSNSIEAVRISTCRICSIIDNSFQSANTVGALLKIHNGNTYLSCAVGNGACFPGGSGSGSNCDSTGGTPTYASCWTGNYTEKLEISDNLFSGISGSQAVELAPQNSGADERLRNIIFERNVFYATANSATEGSWVLVSAVNTSLRDNAMYIASGLSTPPEYAFQICSRAGTINGVLNPIPAGVEIYNNSLAALSTNNTNESVAGFTITGPCAGSPGENSFASNNMMYTTTSGYSPVYNQGTGNTITANTTNTTNNPGWTDGSGTWKVISDWTPSANYSGGTRVPNWHDALGVAWSPTWDLGALHP